MNEIEVKILEIDKDKVEAQLTKLGAAKVFEGELNWTAFDFNDRRFSNNEILLRLRKEGEDTKLTLKKLVSLEGAKTSEEIEVAVDDYESTKKILLALGLNEKKGYPLSKHRVSYLLDNTHFEIDTFAQFPTFLEIEASNQKLAYEYAEKLGFAKQDIKPWGTRELFAYYKKQNIK